MQLRELRDYLDVYLNVEAVPDDPGAVNGLQVESSGRVTRVAAAVDASQDAIDEAIRRGCDLLLVHHGLFWDGNRPVSGRRYRRLKALLDADVAVYSAHLPLDVHPEVGNNAVLARELGLDVDGDFGSYKGIPVGLAGELDIDRDELRDRLERILGGAVRVIPGGPERVRRIGIITGGAGSQVGEASRAGLDAFITGEGAHHTYFDAMEGAVNVFYGGHYATETFGVRALAAHLEQRFGLPWEMLELPTGL